MHRKIYREIAKKHGVSPQEVQGEIQAAIQAAYTNPGRNAATKRRQAEVLRTRDIPSNEELIASLARKVKRSRE